jgi:RHS repeat-associated protein
MHSPAVVTSPWLRRVLFLIGLFLSSLAHATDTVTYYHLDALGSPVAATDEQGNVIWREDYKPYGDRIGKDPAAANNTRWFTGHPHDEASGLTYMGARWYDPTVGRFMGVDPAAIQAGNIHSFNRYGYANNNPYRYVDPDGESAILGSLVLVGTVALIYYDLSRPPVPGDSIDQVGIPIGPIRGFSGVKAASKVVGEVREVAKIGEAAATRDALAESLAPLKGKAPAAVTGGYNVRTGEVAARACGGGKRAEDHVVGALGGKKADVRFTTAKRPRTGEEVPVCPRCESSYGRDSFPPETKFKTDGK